MKIPIPEAPTGITGAMWAVACAVGIYVSMLALALVWKWLVLLPNLVMLVACVYLIGGELWNRRYE